MISFNIFIFKSFLKIYFLRSNVTNNQSAHSLGGFHPAMTVGTGDEVSILAITWS